jgi:hypothetical protein
MTLRSDSVRCVDEPGSRPRPPSLLTFSTRWFSFCDVVAAVFVGSGMICWFMVVSLGFIF